MAPGERMGGTTHGVGWGRRKYHPGQQRGDQTDYGEYNILMLEYLAGRPGPTAPVDLAELIPVWEKRLNSPSWGAWKCTQTKQTLQQVAQGVPHNSLGGMSNAMSMRSAAALAAFSTEDQVAAAARKMMFTHRNEEALSGGEFFARVAFKIARNGMSPREAIDATAGMSGWIQQQVRKGIAKFEEAVDPSKPLSKEEFVDDLAMTSMARLWDVGKTEPIKAAIPLHRTTASGHPSILLPTGLARADPPCTRPCYFAQVGKASPTEGTLPSSVYIILKYADDFAAAVKANAMVGGDNASRAVAIGMVLGAYHGLEGIPAALRDGLNAWKKCDALLGKLPLLRQKSEL